MGLVLSREAGQQVVIGEGEDQVTFTVVEIRTRPVRVRLHFEAPKHIKIDRKEVRVRIEKEGRDKL